MDMQVLEVWQFLRIWGSVIGPALDIVGAIFVYVGVRTSIHKANALEQIAVPRLINDIGSPENIKQNQTLSNARAVERLRASRWAALGLALFVIGFALQVIGAWPKS